MTQDKYETIDIEDYIASLEASTPKEVSVSDAPSVKGRQEFKPFQYPWAWDLMQKHEKIHWLPTEVSLAQDVVDWDDKLSQGERDLLTQLFKFFTQADTQVLEGYAGLLLPTFHKTPELGALFGSIAARESVHCWGYSLLIETLGFDESQYTEFKQIEAMAEKDAYVNTFSMETPWDVAKTLAVYGAFVEGIQLFSSFAMLMNFPRFNKMNGMSKIVEWSVRDEECFSDDTEILTQVGFKKFKDLVKGVDLVAQYDQGEISFVEPLKYIQKTVDQNLVAIKNTYNVNQLVTENHDVLYINPTLKTPIYTKEKAKDFIPHYRRKIPVAGFLKQDAHQGASQDLTPLERLFVALQADGSIPKGDNRTGEVCGHRRVNFWFKKERKVKRFLEILESTGLDFTHTPTYSEKKGEGHQFYVNIPLNHPVTKNFEDWVNPTSRSKEWLEDFVQEVAEWDGHRPSDERISYSSTNEKNSEIVQIAAILSGSKASLSRVVDDRKETFSDIFKVHIIVGKDLQPTGQVTKEAVPYKGEVYCVNVPSGAVVVRRNGIVNVSGNCHVSACVEMYHTWLSENPQLDQVALGTEVTQVCRKMVELEDAFIDVAFGITNIEGMSADEIKTYIRHIADQRLKALKLEPIYGDNPNPLKWFDEMLYATSHTNFFENRETNYTHGSIVDDSSEMDEW